MKYAVFYGVVMEVDDETFFDCDCPYLGGSELPNEQSAERLMRELAEDKGIPGIVISKSFPYEDGLSDIHKQARRQFNQIANDMYDVEEIAQRKEAARKANR